MGLLESYRQWLRKRNTPQAKPRIKAPTSAGANVPPKVVSAKTKADLVREMAELWKYESQIATPAQPMEEKDAYSIGYRHGYWRREFQPDNYDRSQYAQGYADGKGDRSSQLEEIKGKNGMRYI